MSLVEIYTTNTSNCIQKNARDICTGTSNTHLHRAQNSTNTCKHCHRTVNENSAFAMLFITYVLAHTYKPRSYSIRIKLVHTLADSHVCASKNVKKLLYWNRRQKHFWQFTLRITYNLRFTFIIFFIFVVLSITLSFNYKYSFGFFPYR